MSEPAATPPPGMTATEFLTWDDGTDMTYELVDGLALPRYARSGRWPPPPEVAPPTPRHGVLIANAGCEIGEWLKGHRSCHAAVIAAVWVDDSNVCVADVVATCTPATADAVCVPDPFLIVELLSTPTGAGASSRRSTATWPYPPSGRSGYSTAGGAGSATSAGSTRPAGPFDPRSPAPPPSRARRSAASPSP
jgi:hypothetical protein